MVSATTQLKLLARDGKKRLTDVLDYKGIIALGKEFTSKKANLEGNDRSTRIWLDLILKKRLRMCVDWSKIGKADYMKAMVKSPLKSSALKKLLKNALTTEIDSREMFMKGIDYSYYYQEN